MVVSAAGHTIGEETPAGTPPARAPAGTPPADTDARPNACSRAAAGTTRCARRA